MEVVTCIWFKGNTWVISYRNKEYNMVNMDVFLCALYGSRIPPHWEKKNPHQIKIKSKYCPPGPLSIRPIPTRTTPHKDDNPQVNPLIGTDTCLHGGEWSGYSFIYQLLQTSKLSVPLIFCYFFKKYNPPQKKKKKKKKKNHSDFIKCTLPKSIELQLLPEKVIQKSISIEHAGLM